MGEIERLFRNRENFGIECILSCDAGGLLVYQRWTIGLTGEARPKQGQILSFMNGFGSARWRMKPRIME